MKWMLVIKGNSTTFNNEKDIYHTVGCKRPSQEKYVTSKLRKLTVICKTIKTVKTILGHETMTTTELQDCNVRHAHIECGG